MKTMDTLTLKFVSYYGLLDPKRRTGIHDLLHWFHYEFVFGRSYLLDAELGKGAWSLCWVIGGLLDPSEQRPGYGIILRNGVPYPQKQRQNDAWIVRHSEYMGFRASHKTTRMHIRDGLKNNPAPYFRSEEEYIKHFRLSPKVVAGRPIRQLIGELGGEGWRASCAIGVAHGKKIFCFPYMEYVLPYSIEEYRDFGLKEMIGLLCDTGALVLVPAIARKGAETLCDEIVPLETNQEVEALRWTFLEQYIMESGEYLCVWCAENRSADSSIAWSFLKNGLQIHGVSCVEKHTAEEYDKVQAQLQADGWGVIGVGSGIVAQTTMLRRPKPQKV